MSDLEALPEDMDTDPERRMALRVLVVFAWAFCLVMVLLGLASIYNSLATASPDLSPNSAELVISFVSTATTVVAGAVGASLYPTSKRLPQGVGRSVLILASGTAAFFVLQVIGAILASLKNEGGITDTHGKVLLIIATAMMSVLAYAGGTKVASALEEASRLAQEAERFAPVTAPVEDEPVEELLEELQESDEVVVEDEPLVEESEPMVQVIHPQFYDQTREQGP